MSLDPQIVGRWGRLNGDPQLRGHFGRIPFDLFAGVVTAGKARLSEVLVGAAVLSAGGSVALLSEVSAGSAVMSEGGAAAVLSEVLQGSAKLSEDC